jgi:protein ImuA
MADMIPTIAALRERLSIMDRVRPPKGRTALSLGLSCLDAALAGGGLVRGGLHEFLPGPADAACHGFVASLLSGLPPGPILWCRHREKGDLLGQADMPYGPGLAALGLDAARLILLRPGSADDALWALEEALRCPALAAVVGDGVSPGPVALRRLQLAAEDGGALGILILPPLEIGRAHV